MTQATPSPDFKVKVAQGHDPKLYDAQHVEPGLLRSDLTDERFLELYRAQGYVAVRDFFDTGRALAARDALVDLVMGRNDAFTADKHLMLEAAGESQWSALPLQQREDVVRKLMNFAEFDERLSALMEDPDLLSHVSLLMDGSTPKLFQQMALIKPPRIGREKPWHQDHAYFRVPLDVPIVGCWIALDEATVANGCMHVMPGDHRDGPIIHGKVRDWQICDRDILGRGCTAVPLPPGGVLFFSSLTPHGTPTNFSDQRRRAIQYHYAPTDHPTMDAEAHKALFGDQAGEVPC